MPAKNSGQRFDSEHNLITARLVLEPLLAAHARKLYPRLRDQRLYRYHRGRPANIAALEQRFARWEKRGSPDGREIWVNFAVRRQAGPYVGWIQATVTDATAIIGYDIFVDYWRRGYAKEACTKLIGHLASGYGVEKFIAVVDVENAPSIALLETLGFQRAWTGPSEDMPGRGDYRYELDL